jgi:hypothetical protein
MQMLVRNDLGFPPASPSALPSLPPAPVQSCLVEMQFCALGRRWRLWRQSWLWWGCQGSVHDRRNAVSLCVC